MEALISDKVRQLREARGWSRAELSHVISQRTGQRVPVDTIEAIESNPGRVPKLEIIEALAVGLDVRPEDFYEWPIAAARAGRPPAVSSRDAGAEGGLPAPSDRGALGHEIRDSPPTRQDLPRTENRRALG